MTINEFEKIEQGINLLMLQSEVDARVRRQNGDPGSSEESYFMIDGNKVRFDLNVNWIQDQRYVDKLLNIYNTLRFDRERLMSDELTSISSNRASEILSHIPEHFLKDKEMIAHFVKLNPRIFSRYAEMGKPSPNFVVKLAISNSKILDYVKTFDTESYYEYFIKNEKVDQLLNDTDAFESLLKIKNAKEDWMIDFYYRKIIEKQSKNFSLQFKTFMSLLSKYKPHTLYADTEYLMKNGGAWYNHEKENSEDRQRQIMAHLPYDLSRLKPSKKALEEAEREVDLANKKEAKKNRLDFAKEQREMWLSLIKIDPILVRDHIPSHLLDVDSEFYSDSFYEKAFGIIYEKLDEMYYFYPQKHKFDATLTTGRGMVVLCRTKNGEVVKNEVVK